MPSPNRYNENKIYQPMDVQTELPYDIQSAIDDFLLDLNENEGKLADCYECEIRNILNCYMDELDEDLFWQLRDYYCLGGIYE